MYVKKICGDVLRGIHSDNAKEYLAAANIVAAYQVISTMRTTSPYIPEENGVAERINRIIQK